MVEFKEREAFLIKLSEKLVGQWSLSDEERVFVRVWGLEADVNNGGFHQYYFNTAGDDAVDAEDALRRIGAQNAAAIVAQANGVFPGGAPPTDRAERQGMLDDLEDDALAKLDQLDNKFFSYPDDLSQLLYDFVIEHKSGFSGLS